LVLGYLCVLFLATLLGSGATRLACLQRIVLLIALLATMLMLVRGRIVRESAVSALGYRVVLYGVVQASYFMLRDILPVVTSRAHDETLHRLDVWLFGVEPTLFLDGFVSSATTEWFAFFYYGYFFLLAIHVWPMLFLCRRSGLLAEFGLAIILLFCTAHLLYMVVPGWGPLVHLAGEYRHALPDGRFHRLMLDAVARGGAQKDIFPSLHTAGPTLIALFSIRHRRLLPFKYTWLPATLFAANVIVATVFLRWHYAIDVLAGLALASGCLWVATKAAPRERADRAQRGAMEVWPDYAPFSPQAQICAPIGSQRSLGSRGLIGASGRGKKTM